MPSNERTTPINKIQQGFRGRLNNNEGSMVVEASIVFPAFIMFIFFLIYMVQMTVISSQLHTAANNAVKQVSTHMYPVALAISFKSSDQDKEDKTGWDIPKLSLTEWAKQYSDSLPQPMSDWLLVAAAKGDVPLQDLKNIVSEAVLDPVIKPLLTPVLEGTLLNMDRLHVTQVIVPDMKIGNNPYFGIEISYELPIKVPFTHEKIVLQAKAEERLWIGDTDEQNSNAKDASTEDGQFAIVISKPNPAFAGHKAKIIAKIEPGSSAKITVYYKSGKSVAKYLGEQTSDDQGIVEWEWLVGGNTTPGMWTFVIETAAGKYTTEQFQVQSPK